MDRQGIFLVSPLAGIFPPMTEDEYARLEESIRETGLLEEITLWRGTVIDGFHRLRACLRLGVEPRFSSLPDDADPLVHVIGKNDSRRSLAPWQRPVAAFRASESSRVGRPRSAGENCANLRNFLTQAEAAGLFRVSRRSVSAASHVLGRESPATPELRRAVLSGRITVSDAAAAVREPAAVQSRAVDLTLRREARTIRQAVNMVKEFGLPEGIKSAEALPVAVDNAPPVFHQSAVSGLHGLVEPESVDAIVTFPPADAWSGSLLTDLASCAAHSLKRSGGMFVLAGSERLPEFIERLRHPDLNWVCALHYVHHVRATGSRRNPRGGAAPGQKLLLVYGKEGFRLKGGDGVISALPSDEGTQGNRRGHLDLGMELIISRFTRSGDLVCDPLLLGRKESVLAAIKQGRRFVGADHDASRLKTVVRQLERARNAGSLSGEG